MNNKTKISTLRSLRNLPPNVTRKIFHILKPRHQHEVISAGNEHNLGLQADGTCVAWGDNRYGQSEKQSKKFIAISAGMFHSLGLQADGTCVAWGSNLWGESDEQSKKFIAISAGWEHSLGLQADGTCVAWGDNYNGECDEQSKKFIAISAGGAHSLGLQADGTCVAWGWNNKGQCDEQSKKFIAISAGGTHSLGLQADGTCVAWGSNVYGQCKKQSKKFIAISAGVTLSLGLQADGTCVCWGMINKFINWDINNYRQCSAPNTKFGASLKYPSRTNPKSVKERIKTIRNSHLTKPLPQNKNQLMQLTKNDMLKRIKPSKTNYTKNQLARLTKSNLSDIIMKSSTSPLHKASGSTSSRNSHQNRKGKAKPYLPVFNKKGKLVKTKPKLMNFSKMKLT